MSKASVMLLLSVCLAGCSASHNAAQGGAMSPSPGMVVVLTPAGAHAANLGLRLIPQTDLGPAVLTVTGKGIKVLPKAQRRLRLAPPPPPPPVKHGPYPLGRVLIEVFRLESATTGSHLVQVTLTWKGGSLSRQIQWTN